MKSFRQTFKDMRGDSMAALLQKHEVKYMSKKSNKKGHRKRMCATISSGYYNWIQMPDKKSIVKTSDQEIKSFIIDPTHTESLPHGNQRHEWRESASPGS